MTEYLTKHCPKLSKFVDFMDSIFAPGGMSEGLLSDNKVVAVSDESETARIYNSLVQRSVQPLSEKYMNKFATLSIF